MRSGSCTDPILSTFQDYVGMKIHFNDEMVFTRHTNMSKIGMAALSRRKDIGYFIRFMEKYPERETRLQRMVSAFKFNPEAWIGDFSLEDYKAAHNARMSICSALRHHIRADIQKIQNYMLERKITVRTLLSSTQGIPYIIEHEDELPLKDETLTLLQKAFRFCGKAESIDPRWNRRQMMLSKYHYWLDVSDTFLDEQFSIICANP